MDIILMYQILHGFDERPFDDVPSYHHTASYKIKYLQALLKFLSPELQEVYFVQQIIYNWNDLLQEVIKLDKACVDLGMDFK